MRLALLPYAKIRDFVRLEACRTAVDLFGIGTAFLSLGEKTRYSQIIKERSPWIRGVLIEVTPYLIQV